MASHSANGLTFYLSLPPEDKDYLGAVRHWTNVKIGFDEEAVWLKDLSPVQVDSIEIKSLPHKHIFYAQDAQLFLKGSLLPHGALPSLLWTPIDRGLPVQLPSFNHNYFGLNNKAEITLCGSDEEREPYGLMTNLKDLQRYAQTAPAVRLRGLQWAVTGEENAMIVGAPLLPLQGEAFCRSGDFLFPAGYGLSLPRLRETLQEALSPEGDSWIVWNKKGTYWKIHKEALSALSIASVRKTGGGLFAPR